jgi:hypothetical protein
MKPHLTFPFGPTTERRFSFSFQVSKMSYTVRLLVLRVRDIRWGYTVRLPVSGIRDIRWVLQCVYQRWHFGAESNSESDSFSSDFMVKFCVQNFNLQAFFYSAQHLYEKREGAGAGSGPLNNGSGSGRLKDMRIRIPNNGVYSIKVQRPTVIMIIVTNVWRLDRHWSAPLCTNQIRSSRTMLRFEDNMS